MFGDIEFWQPVVDRLAPHRRCLLLDHRGIGQSERWTGTYTYERWALDVVEFLDHLDLGTAPVLGLCQGGMVGAVMARDHAARISGLVAFGTRLLESAKVRVWDRFRSKLLSLGGVELLMASQMGQVFGEAILTQIEPHLDRMASKAVQRMDVPSAAKMLEALADFSMDPLEIASMTKPALFLAGEEDLYVPPFLARKTASLWPQSEFVVLAGVGHIVPREAPEEFARLTLSFLERHQL